MIDSVTKDDIPCRAFQWAQHLLECNGYIPSMIFLRMFKVSMLFLAGRFNGQNAYLKGTGIQLVDPYMALQGRVLNNTILPEVEYAFYCKKNKKRCLKTNILCCRLYVIYMWICLKFNFAFLLYICHIVLILYNLYLFMHLYIVCKALKSLPY